MSAIFAWLDRRGSSRPMGALRPVLALILWARYAEWMAAFHWQSSADAARAAVFWVGTSGLLLGLGSRLCALSLGLLQAWWVLGSGEPRFDHHHTWLLASASLLLALTPCDRSFALDRAVVRWWTGAAPAEEGEQWGVTLLALQVSGLYLCATIDKLIPGFLAGDRLEMIAASLYLGSDPLPGWTHTLAVGCAWATVVIEGFLAFGFWFRATRPWAIGLGITLHALFYVLLPVSTFSVTSVALYLAFLDPAAFHAWTERGLTGRSPPTP